MYVFNFMRSEIGEGMMKEQFKQVAVCHVKCFIHTPRFCSKRKERCIPVTIQTSVNDVKNQSYRSKAIPSGDEPHEMKLNVPIIVFIAIVMTAKAILRTCRSSGL